MTAVHITTVQPNSGIVSMLNVNRWDSRSSLCRLGQSRDKMYFLEISYTFVCWNSYCFLGNPLESFCFNINFVSLSAEWSATRGQSQTVLIMKTNHISILSFFYSDSICPSRCNPSHPHIWSLPPNMQRARPLLRRAHHHAMNIGFSKSQPSAEGSFQFNSIHLRIG